MFYKIHPLGESAVTIDFGNEISEKKNLFVVNLCEFIESNKFKGFIECVPAYSTLTIFYNPFVVKQHNPLTKSAFEFVIAFAEQAIKNTTNQAKSKSNMIEIPVSFDKNCALDLEYVAETNSLEPSEVIEIFLSKIYRVFMLGFLPGFAYMGMLDSRISTKRKVKPRAKVPKGSLGIAGIQTGIYPLESPGGWQIIGKTDTELFTPKEKAPTYLQTGDLIKFV